MEDRVISAGGVFLLVAAGTLVAGAVMGQVGRAVAIAVLVGGFFGVLTFMISEGEGN